MEIHKPKPAHNLREFLSEIAIVVIGIAIALGGEQTIEALSWRAKVADAVQAMRHEIADDDGPQAIAREVSQRCFDDQLAALRTAVESRAPRADIIRLARAYKPPFRTWDDASWLAALSSGVLAHFTADELGNWSAVFSLMPTLQRSANGEIDNATELQAIMPGPGSLSDEESARILRDVVVLARLNRSMSGLSFLMNQAAAKVGAAPPPAARQKVLAEARHRFGACAGRYLPPFALIPGAQLQNGP